MSGNKKIYRFAGNYFYQFSEMNEFHSGLWLKENNKII